MFQSRTTISSEAKGSEEKTHPQGELLTDFAIRHGIQLKPSFGFMPVPYLPQVFRDKPFRINEPFNSEGDPLAIFIIKALLEEHQFERKQLINLLGKLMAKDSGYNHHLRDKKGATFLMHFFHV